MGTDEFANQISLPPNTPQQEAAHQAAEAAWAEEKTWPRWRITLVGDETVYVPRADERYWRQEDPDDPNSRWVPKAVEDLAEDAHLNEGGNVVRTAYAVVQCFARSEDHAKMMAMKDNPTYHTVVLVEQIHPGTSENAENVPQE